MVLISLTGEHVEHETYNVCVVDSFDKEQMARKIIYDKYHVRFEDTPIVNTPYYKVYNNITDDRNINLAVEYVEYIGDDSSH